MPLVDELTSDGWLKSPHIIEAFKTIKRADFLPDDLKELTEFNEALAIGYGQTISQPLVVAFMLELLSPQPGEKILDIGSGSGWTTALLAFILSGGELNEKVNPVRKGKPLDSTVPSEMGSELYLSQPSQEAELSNGVKSKNEKPNGKIIAIEIVPELCEFGKQNVAKYNFIEKGIVEFLCTDGSKGYEKEAPFDKILASASVQEKIPEPWKKQLKVGGRIVAPVENSIWLLGKKGENEFEETEYPGFVFVPLVEK